MNFLLFLKIERENFFLVRKIKFSTLSVIFFMAWLAVFPLSSSGKSPVNPFTVEFPEIIVQRIPCDIVIEIETPNDIAPCDTVYKEVLIDGELIILPFVDGKSTLSRTFDKPAVFSAESGGQRIEKKITPIPLWMSILPPLIAILIALIFREVYSALFLGLLVGATIISYFKGFTFFMAIFKGLFMIIDYYIIHSLMDEGHMSIIVFSMMIGAMVHLITRNGGMRGVVNYLSKYATSPRSGQFITWIMGVLIFFDDYANTLVVGNTMRPVTDRLRISRQKLAYIVDSTAAPVAAIAFVTTWIGAELSYIQDGILTIGIDESPYTIFLNSLSYSFYPIFTLCFMIFLLWRGVDFGPMLSRERLARKEGVEAVPGTLTVSAQVVHDEDAIKEHKVRWFNAVIPVLVIVFGTFAGLLYTGWDQSIWNSESMRFTTKLSATIGNSNAYKALLWASLSGTLVALLLTVSQRILSLKESIESLVSGFKTMLTAILILIMAWAIALVTKDMHTADFISGSMLEMSVSPYLVPAITFILAALVSFSTGTSWGTMAILYPLILPASWLIAQDSGFDHDQSLAIFHNVVSAVLAGSVLGDHCSPISDTTILSSLASSCDHIEHVRTQLPYALSVGVVSIFIGTIPAAFGAPFWITFPAGLVILYLLIRFIGKKTENGRVYKF